MLLQPDAITSLAHTELRVQIIGPSLWTRYEKMEAMLADGRLRDLRSNKALTVEFHAKFSNATGDCE